ncbi:MAG TPA: hypothetical protein VI112_04410 [Bacteroidia bacterium]|jgi:hypothetical protein
MEYFEDDNVDDDTKRNVAFQVLSAVRECITLALKTKQPYTYENSFDIVHRLSPVLYRHLCKLLPSKNESDLVRQLREEADILSTDTNIVTPIDVIDKEVARLRGLLNSTQKKNTKLTKKKLSSYLAAKKTFREREVAEGRMLTHDVYLATRGDMFDPYKDPNMLHVDYKLPTGRRLRLRLLHPDKGEQILGADLIYEQHDLKRKLARFAHLQYKVWDKKTIYFSKGSVSDQLEKLNSHLCIPGYCHNQAGNSYSEDYRMPYCSAFLRPTDRIQDVHSKFKTSGIHLPICAALKLRQRNSKIDKEDLKGRCITHNIFEEMFNANLLGSRWITFEDLEKFYEKTPVLADLKTIRIHATEVDTGFEDK